MRYFGTDGIRGVANEELTPELAMRAGRAAAHALIDRADASQPIVVGRDTRLSGPMLESALMAGIASVGRHAISVGVLPTPAIACIVRATGAAAGAMISASHNPIADNGIKFFGADGFKLSDAVEAAIEAVMERDEFERPTGVGIGQITTAQNLGKHYYALLEGLGVDLHGIEVVVDAAYGAAYAVAPHALRNSGAIVHELHCEHDGARINVHCGATHLEPLREAVTALHASGKKHVVGVAFDGDADRALFIDERGATVTGDHILYALALAARAHHEVRADRVVGTVMSNIGLERALTAQGIALDRTAVGDRYLLARMRESGAFLGAEQSGHVIDLRSNTTGDGTMTAFAILGEMARSRQRLADLVAAVVEAPQVLQNVRVHSKASAQHQGVLEAIDRVERSLAGRGRILVRPSGTEPLVRVMVEGDDHEEILRAAAEVSAAIAKVEQEIERGRPTTHAG